MEDKLTTNKIDRYPVEDNDYFVWDTKFTGLGLKVNKGGTKVFVFQARLGGIGNAKRRTIGKHPMTSLQQAIDIAQEWSQLFATGIDPKDKRDDQLKKNHAREKAAVQAGITFGTAFTDYFERKKGGWSARYITDHRDAAKPHLSDKDYQPGCFDYIWDKLLTELTPELIEQWVHHENETRASRMAQAHRMYKAFVNWSSEIEEYKGLVPDKSATAKIVSSSIKKAGRHKDTLQRQQLKPWFDLVTSDAISDSHAAALICMLMNGSRPNEMLSLKWSDVDFKWKTIKITDKVDQWERIIPLTPYTEKMMLSLPKINDYVFGSTRNKTSFIKIGDTYRNAVLKSGLPSLPPKAMRKSFSNLSEWVSVPYGIVKQIMGHRPSATDEKHYKDRAIDLLRFWHIKIEQFILAEAGVDISDVYPDIKKDDIYKYVVSYDRSQID